MKNILFATVAVFGFAGAAAAEGTLLPVPVTGAAEYSIENETMDFDLGTEIAFGNFAFVPNANMSWSDADSLTFDGVDLTGVYMLGNNIDLYAGVELDGDMEHTDTTVGVAFRF